MIVYCELCHASHESTTFWRSIFSARVACPEDHRCINVITHTPPTKCSLLWSDVISILGIGQCQFCIKCIGYLYDEVMLGNIESSIYLFIEKMYFHGLFKMILIVVYLTWPNCCNHIAGKVTSSCLFCKLTCPSIAEMHWLLGYPQDRLP